MVVVEKLTDKLCLFYFSNKIKVHTVRFGRKINKFEALKLHGVKY